MKFYSHLIVILFALLVVFSSCKKEEEEDLIPCDENYYQIDESKISKKVLIVGIDGFRQDVLTVNNAPFLSEFGTRSSTYFTRKHETESITLSGPNWTSMLTGVRTQKHQILGNFFPIGQATEYPHFFKYIEGARNNINTVSICHWLPINSGIADGFVDYSPIELYTDEDVYNQAIRVINNTDSVSGDVIFLHFDDLDHNGHAHGFHDSIPEYVAAVSMMDGYAEGLVNAVEARRSLGEDWLIIMVSDHGGEGTSHTGMWSNPDVSQTVFFANHPNLTFKNDHITTQVDLAPTVLSFLGIYNAKFDCDHDGVSVIE